MKSAVLLLWVILFTQIAFAQNSNCTAMADMAQDIANIRDMGVPLSAVEERLARDVPDKKERALGMLTAKIVYSVKYTGAALKKEILKNCKT